MPTIGAKKIASVTLDAFQSSGVSAVLVSKVGKQPREFVVQTFDGSISVRAYVYTITHGGKTRDEDEFRIQNSAGVGRVVINPMGYTVLLGYFPDTQTFAGFDVRLHDASQSRSPSLQIKLGYLHQALSDGLSYYKKDNSEIVVAIRPDQLLNYILHANELHRFGVQAEMFDLLSKASALQQVPETALTALSEPRKRIIRTIAQLSRDSNFKQTVRQAYDNRCAVTRMQLRLCDAAHILPVLAPGSVDEARNGLFLSATYHRAFDTGLIYLDEKLVMRLNPKRAEELTAARLDGGLHEFRSTVGRPIHLPPDVAQRPDPALIRQANIYRRIAV